MASKIKLLNSEGTTLTVSNSDLLLQDKDVIYLDTVEQLTNASGSNGDVAHVSDLDRGGVFVYDSTSTDNQGTVFGSWVRQYEGAVNVKWFGAVGDGNDANNDSTPISNTITYASNNFKNVYIPSGSYIIKSNIELKSNIKVYGEKHNTIFLLSGDNRRGFNASNLENCLVKDIIFDGQKPDVGWQTTNNYDFGIRLGAGATGQTVINITIKGCIFKDIGLDGIYVENYNNINVYQCEFLNCRRWGVVPVGGAFEGHNFTISDCYFECETASGPEGKELPLGAIDSEPATTVKNIKYSMLKGKGNKTLMYASSSNIYNGSIEDTNISDSILTVNNNNVNISNVTLEGNSYFVCDSANDSRVTKVDNFDIKFKDTGREPTLNTEGGANILPYSFVNVKFADVLSFSGSYSVDNGVLRVIDDVPSVLSQLNIGPGTGNCLTKFNTNTTIKENDQVVIYLEIERTDNSTDDGSQNTLSVAYNGVNRLYGLSQGHTNIMIAFKNETEVVNPLFQVGLSGSPTSKVSILVRKMRIEINPKSINNLLYSTTKKEITYSINNFTGPQVEVDNISLLVLSASTSQNLDRLENGYIGQKITIHSTYYPITIRDYRVSGVTNGNITLTNRDVARLYKDTWIYGMTLIYNGLYWIQA